MRIPNRLDGQHEYETNPFTPAQKALIAEIKKPQLAKDVGERTEQFKQTKDTYTKPNAMD